MFNFMFVLFLTSFLIMTGAGASCADEADDSVMYHTGLSVSALEGAELALLPGDPGRVEYLAKSLDSNAKFAASHREYTSWLAQVGGRRILVCSTGMGGPSVAIAMEELARIGIKYMIRVGTTGAIQEQIELGDVIINDASVRLDGASSHYAPTEFPAAADLDITLALRTAAEEAGVPFHVGISVCSDTFWPGQERYDSFTGYVPRRFQGSMKEWRTLGALNYEMETGTLFTVARVMGLKAGSICGAMARRTESESVASADIYEMSMNRITAVLDRAIKLFFSGDLNRRPLKASDIVGGYMHKTHEENGMYVERHYASEGPERPASGCIYYSLAPDEVSMFHVIDCDEYWVWSAGSPLEIWQVAPDGKLSKDLLGIGKAPSGELMQPTVLIRAGTIFAAKHLSGADDSTFISCITVPRFRYEGWRLVEKDEVVKLCPEAAGFFDQTGKRL